MLLLLLLLLLLLQCGDTLAQPTQHVPQVRRGKLKRI